MPLLIAPLIGRYGNNIDMRILVTFSFIMYAVCFYWRAITFNLGLDFTLDGDTAVFAGFCRRLLFLPLTTISLGISSGEICRRHQLKQLFPDAVGIDISTTITMTLWSRRESFHHAQLTESITPFNPQSVGLFSKLQGMGFSQQQIASPISTIKSRSKVC